MPDTMPAIVPTGAALTFAWLSGMLSLCVVAQAFIASLLNIKQVRAKQDCVGLEIQ